MLDHIARFIDFGSGFEGKCCHIKYRDPDYLLVRLIQLITQLFQSALRGYKLQVWTLVCSASSELDASLNMQLFREMIVLAHFIDSQLCCL